MKGDDENDVELNEQDDGNNREDDVDLENSPSKNSAGGLIAGILVPLFLIVVGAVLCMRKKEQARQRVLTNAAALRRRGVRQQNAVYAGDGSGGGGGRAGGNGNDNGNVSDEEPTYGNDEFGNVEPKPDNYGYGIPDPLPEGHDGSTGSNAAAAATYSSGLPSM